MHFIFNKVNGYFEVINGTKYLTLVPTNESKEKIKTYEEKMRPLISSIAKNSDDYDEEYMKKKFDLDDNLPLNKTIEIPIVTIVVKAVFHENNKYYLQVFLDEFMYKI